MFRFGLDSPCYLTVVSGGFFFLNKDTRRCFLWCLQVSSSSSLLFNIEFWSAVRIMSCSVRPPLENACPLALIDHFISNSVRHKSHARPPLENAQCMPPCLNWPLYIRLLKSNLSPVAREVNSEMFRNQIYFSFLPKYLNPRKKSLKSQWKYHDEECPLEFHYCK